MPRGLVLVNMVLFPHLSLSLPLFLTTFTDGKFPTRFQGIIQAKKQELR